MDRTPDFRPENEGSIPSSPTIKDWLKIRRTMTVKLIEELHTPFTNEERWGIASRYLEAAYILGEVYMHSCTPPPGATDSAGLSESPDAGSTPAEETKIAWIGPKDRKHLWCTDHMCFDECL